MEVAKLSYVMLNFIEWYGNFTTAEALANLRGYPGAIKYVTKKYKLKKEEIDNISFDYEATAQETLAILYSKGELDKLSPKYKYYQALGELVLNLNVWFQPGVEWGKTAAKKIAERLYVRFSRSCQAEGNPVQAGKIL